MEDEKFAFFVEWYDPNSMLVKKYQLLYHAGGVIEMVILALALYTIANASRSRYSTTERVAFRPPLPQKNPLPWC